MKKSIICALIALLLFGTISASGAEVTQRPKFENFNEFPKLDGSTSTTLLSHAIAKEFLQLTDEEAMINIVHYGTSQSYYDLIFESTDLILAVQPPSNVVDYMKEYNEVPITSEVVANDALVFITHKDNPINNLTMDQVRDIYAGKITNWKDVGGENLPIAPYQRNESSGSQTLILSLLMGETPMMVPDKEQLFSSMEGLVEGIAQYKASSGSLGYSVYYYITTLVDSEGIKLLSIDGIAPNIDTIATGAYPLIAPIFASIREKEPENSPTRKLFNWLQTEDGQATILKSGFVPAVLPQPWPTEAPVLSAATEEKVVETEVPKATVVPKK